MGGCVDESLGCALVVLMPPRQSSHSDLFLDMPAASLEGTRQPANETTLTAATLTAAAVRGDYAGVPASMLVRPKTYQQRVIRMWEFYNSDPFFHALVNRICDYAANGSRWEVSTPLKRGSWLERLRTWGQSEEGIAAERQEDVWNTWAEHINLDVPGVMAGANQVSMWAAKHLILSGMFVPHWEYGEFKFGKQKLRMPMRITCHPAHLITLRRTNHDFVQEDTFLLKSPEALQIMQEGDVREAPERMGQNQLANQELLPTRWGDESGVNEAMVVKYMWSPADLVSVRTAQRTMTGHGTYPAVPFDALAPQFIIRQQLFASDAAILSGIQNYIKIWKVGTKEVLPVAPVRDASGKVVKDGTVATIRKQVQSQQASGQEVFVPYWVDLDIAMPETTSLLNEQKYWASTLEIFQAFNIFFSRSIGGRNERMEKINIANFEEFLAGLRRHIAAFWHALARRTRHINGESLPGQAVWTPNQVNTKDDKYRSDIRELAKLGRASTETLQRSHGLDSDLEERRIATELARDVDDLMDGNVPLSYVQRAQPAPDIGGEDPAELISPKDKAKKALGKEVRSTPGVQRGRPPSGAPPTERAAEATTDVTASRATRRRSRDEGWEYEVEKKGGKTKVTKKRIRSE